MDKLSYSFHLGNDKNKSKKSRQSIKNGKVIDKVFNNNAIQNANNLSRVNNHNLRKYDDNQELIEIIYGTNNLYDDVKNLYIKEFDEARIKYNEKQTRNDRKINDYFEHISNNDKNDLACEIIIELGDMEFWGDKDDKFKRKMTDVFNQQIKDLEKVVPSFKVANATIHYDESSPHLHIVGVPIKNGNKNGMSKQVGKSTIFTKDSLRVIQDTMRIYCINSFNKVYNSNKELKAKLKGRNEDVPINNMEKEYNRIKKQADVNRQRLEKVSNKTKETLEKSKQIKDIVNNLKSTKITKNNFIINNDDIEIIKNYIDEVDDNVSEIKTVNDLTNVIEDFETALKTHNQQVEDLQLTINKQDKTIKSLESTITKKQETITKRDKKIEGLNQDIIKLEDKISGLEKIIETWKKLWKKFLDFLQDKIFGSQHDSEIYEQFINDLANKNILDSKDIDYIDNGFISKEKDDYEI